MTRLTPRKPDQPVLWIIAGPNGSGKSSFYNRTDIEGWGGSVWIVNPDLLTLRLIEQEALKLEQANRLALDRMMLWLEASIDVHQTIGVETVLSSSKYRKLVKKAKERGFEIRMIYIVLETPELQIERVRLRVSEGGHDVPTGKIVARRQRSFEQLAWFFNEVDRCYIFDNSDGRPDMLAEKVDDKMLFWSQGPTDLVDTLKSKGVKILWFESS
ncbi:hypothetical protein MNBD_ALPHA04-445 [hydrothermal vent metagenome]|uniref:Zeta toxin domain-containing protein n=1 Tax=hydrothermal vent metagenome TaxID=652676 RepID=A0A3B0S857_9ZZZZ